MSNFEEGLKILEDRCGNYKDNIISLATIALNTGENGEAIPCVREVDAYYEDGAFYIITWTNSSKLKQISKNPEVAFAVSNAWISGNGTAQNLGWLFDPKNEEIKNKLRKAFSAWFDHAVSGQDPNCLILTIRIKNAVVIKDYGAVRYYLDFINKTAQDKPVVV